nr:PREDICTED: uncharacterized protein LOC108201523 [Daucus carota subsp. sativus]
MATTNIVDQSQVPTSPYYLHPSDNPGMKLVSLQFDGTGFGDWKRSMMMSLSAKNITGFIDGTIVKPPDTDVLSKPWERCNSMLSSWLVGSLDPSISRSVLYFPTAREIWLNLEERYGQASGTSLYSLQESLHEIRQGTDSISAYFTKIKMIWDQLDAIDTIPTCECNNCTCAITQKLIKSRENRRLTEFLMKLASGYEILRGSMLIMNPLPSISHAYRLLLQEENHKKLTHSSQSHDESMAFAANRRGFDNKFKSRNNYGTNTDGKGRNNYFCDHCKMTGHTIQRCYKLHGYPANFKTDGTKRMAANLSQTDTLDQESSILAADNSAFTPAQMQQLMQLLGKETDSSSTESQLKSAFVAGKMCLLSSSGTSWIIDSGATDHMCNDLTVFSDYKQIQGSDNYIVIPNGKKALITHTGTIHLTKKIVLHDVLYVPDFK